MTGSQIGHNGGPTFDDIVRDNLDRGILIVIKDTILQAVRDPRLERRHLRVLAEVVDMLNLSSGVAYPGRRVLADRSRRYEGFVESSQLVGALKGYSEASIAKTISELISFGYLVSSKRQAEQGGRALSHYTIRRPSIEELQSFISEWVNANRAGRQSFDPGKVKSGPVKAGPASLGDVTPEGNVRGNVTPEGNVTPVGIVRAPDVTPVGNVAHANVTPEGNVTPVGNVTSDVTPVVPTVTSRKELEREIEGERARARDGEQEVGHGVFVNGETIRHAEFVISLPGIALNTIASGLTATEVKDRCVAHALQWAAEIENGGKPRDVVPTKIANFLARSIMSEYAQSAVTHVRMTKAREGYARKPVNPDRPQETDAERFERMAKEFDAEKQQRGVR